MHVIPQRCSSPLQPSNYCRYSHHTLLVLYYYYITLWSLTVVPWHSNHSRSQTGASPVRVQWARPQPRSTACRLRQTRATSSNAFRGSGLMDLAAGTSWTSVDHLNHFHRESAVQHHGRWICIGRIAQRVCLFWSFSRLCPSRTQRVAALPGNPGKRPPL